MGTVTLDTSEPGVAIVMLSGEHELFSASKLQGQLDALIGEGLTVVVDLSRATFLDSSIVSVLLLTREHAANAGTAYSIVLDDTTGDPVRRMFEITGLGALLPLVESRAAALPRAR
jgi:anti-anti-sigma factor